MTRAGKAGTTGRSDRLRQTQQLAEQALESLSEQLGRGNSERLEQFLTTMGRFPRYSFGNLMLILSQKPDATRVAGFRAWKDLGRFVRKGERGIAIIAPMRIRATDDPDAQVGGEGEAGSEESATRSPLRFRVTHVFDISQTEGEPLPDLGCVAGDPGRLLDRLEAGVMSAGILLSESEFLDADGLSRGGGIELNANLESAERFSVLVHEFAHELLHHQKLDRPDDEPRPPKVVRETEAEAVAFAVCEAVGLETNGAAIDYIRLYQGDAETLAQSLDRIRLAVSRVLTILDPSEGSESGSVEAVITAEKFQSDRFGKSR
ncbi:MAG: ArdC-like ssDNA-binding domain-containing protein [Planctomycetota bacterium]